MITCANLTRPGRTAVPATPAPQGKLINRELSWLSFNDRVLSEAGNPEVPGARAVAFRGDRQLESR